MAEEGGTAGVRARREALRLLARRARTAAEMRRALRRRYAAEVVEPLLSALRDEGTLDDRRTARDWLAWRREQDPLGRARLEAELQRRGLPGCEVHAALAEYYAGHDEGEDLSRALLRLLPAPQGAAAMRRLTALLARRGFAPEDVREALRRRGAGPEDDPWGSEN